MKCVIFLLLWISLPFWAQSANDVIINEYNDDGGNCAAPEWVELLVVNGPVDLRNWYVTDREWSILTTDGEGSLQIANDGAFASIPTGTYVVLIEASGTDDTDPSDGVITLYTGNNNLTQSGSWSLAATGDGLALIKDDDQTPAEGDAGEVPIDYVSWGNENDIPSGLSWNGPLSGTEDEDAYFSKGASFNNDDVANWTINADGNGCSERTQGSANPGQSYLFADATGPVFSTTTFTTGSFAGTFSDDKRITAVEVKTLPGGATLTVGGNVLSAGQFHSFSASSLSVTATGSSGNQIAVVMTDTGGNRQVAVINFF